MKTKLLIFSVLIFLTGCATTQKPQPEPSEVIETKIAKVETAPKAEKKSSLSEEPQPENRKEAEEAVEPSHGFIFAKTDFQGVLKKSYVQLTLTQVEDPDNVFQLYIGEVENPKPFSFKIKTVEPGYFFIELPAGNFYVSRIAIPVGSTMAAEDLDVRFEVAPDEVTYIGTLQVTGTKEKIKLGGVPVIKPGFDYTIAVIDESDQAQATFENRYPDIPGRPVKNLMKVRSLSPGSPAD